MKLFIYKLDELTKLCSSFPEVVPEMRMFDCFLNNIQKYYEIVDIFEECDVAFLPIDFTKLIYVSPHHKYSTVPPKCPARPNPHSLIQKRDHIKYFWDMFVDPYTKNQLKLKPHFILYSYVLYEIDFYHIPKEVIIAAYETEVSHQNDINTSKVNHDMIMIPYILNEDRLNSTRIIPKLYFDDLPEDIISNMKSIDVGFFGPISDDSRKILTQSRSFLKHLNPTGYTYFSGDATTVNKNIYKIRYLFVLRGDTYTRRSFYQSFAYWCVPIIYATDATKYQKVMPDGIDVKDVCLILPDNDKTDDCEYAEIVNKILITELKNEENYLNKIKLFSDVFRAFNYFEANCCPPPFKAIIDKVYTTRTSYEIP